MFVIEGYNKAAEGFIRYHGQQVSIRTLGDDRPVARPARPPQIQ
jgi:hypothetical protein